MSVPVELPAQRVAVHRIARALTEMFAPAVLAAVMPVVIALHATDSVAAGAGWGLLVVVFTAVIPYGVIWLGVRRGQLTDHHIGVRSQRRKPLMFGLASVLVGLAVLVLAGAPRELVVMTLVMLLLLLVVGAINLVWKVSAHAAVAAGSAAVLVMVFGPALLLVVPVVVAVGWSRVELRDHTAVQVVVGAVVGVVLAGLFGVLR
ncbi:MAG TPA: hypothetical protein VGJ07_23220 [Rugosimonospora sp.]|jgi:hypothetical protein